MRRRACLLLAFAALMLLGAKEKGCDLEGLEGLEDLSYLLPPLRIEVSADRGTLYFSMAEEVKPLGDEPRLYALDVRSGRLRALSGDPGGLPFLGGDGRTLIHVGGTGEAMLKALDVEDGGERPLPGAAAGEDLPLGVVGDSGDYVLTGSDIDDDAVENFSLFALTGTQKVPADLPSSALFQLSPVSAGGDRFALGLKYGKEVEAREMRLYVGRIEGEKVDVTQAATWKVDGKRRPVMATPAFDSRARVLVVAVIYTEGGENEQTRFYRVDPKGGGKPEPLFTEKRLAWGVTMRDDGKAVAYWRETKPGKAGLDLVLRTLADGKETVLAKLPGKIGDMKFEAFASRLVFTKNGGLIAYHLCDEGLYVFSVKFDGTDRRMRRLPREKLMAQKHLADLEWSLDHLPEFKPGDLPEDIRERYRKLKNLRKALDAEWEKVVGWEDVPVER